MTDIASPVTFTPWTASDFALNMAIWWAMMPGMMLPSAAPMIQQLALRPSTAPQWGRPRVVRGRNHEKLDDPASESVRELFKNADRRVFQPAFQAADIAAVDTSVDRQVFLR